MFLDAIVVIALGVVAVLLPSTGVYRSYLRRKLARETGTSVAPGREPTLEARLTRSARGLGAGILTAGVALLVLSGSWEGADDSAGGFFTLSVMAIAGAAGLVLVDILWPGNPGEGPRTARVTSPTIADYLPRWLRTLSWVVVGTGLVALVATLLVGRTQWFDSDVIQHSPVPLLAVGLPALILLSVWATRRILDAPQPARDETELYWQDAVRAQTLSSLTVTVPFISLLALMVCGTVLDDAASAAARAAGQVGPTWSLVLLIAGYAIPVVMAITILVVTVSRGNNAEMRQFRNRLWNGQPPHPRAQETHA